MNLKFPVLLAALFSMRILGAEAATVGGTPDCDFQDLQAAIDSALDPANMIGELRIASNAAWTGITVDIEFTDATVGHLLLRGGHTSCASESPAPGARSRIDGSATPVLEPMFRIRGNRSSTGVVQFSNLELRNHKSLYGSGIRIEDGHSVDLTGGMYLANLEAVQGGAIWIGTDGHLDAWGEGNVLTFNSATDSGGAIYCRYGSLSMESATISGNSADYGGGLYMYSCQTLLGATSDSQSEPSPSIRDNSAEFDGGGIYADHRSNLVIQGLSDPLRCDLSGNMAGRNGGGIHVTGQLTNLVMGGVRMTDNRAQGNGGAVSAYAAQVVELGDNWLNSEFYGNHSQGHGAVMHLSGTSASMHHALVSSNRGIGGAISRSTFSAVDGAALGLAHTLVTGNEAEALVSIEGSTARLIHVTTAENLIESVVTRSATQVGQYLHLRHLVVAEDLTDSALLTGDTHTVNAECLIGNNLGPVSPSEGYAVFEDQVVFRNPDVGDFRLAWGSPGLDTCQQLVGSDGTFDLDGHQRNSDIDAIPDIQGKTDLGAYESDYLFVNRFEA
jgi:hypothetical protein